MVNFVHLHWLVATTWLVSYLHCCMWEYQVQCQYPSILSYHETHDYYWAEVIWFYFMQLLGLLSAHTM